MSRIEFFNKGYAAVGVKLGIISPSMLMYYEHYKAFIQKIKEGMPEIEARDEVCRAYKCSDSTVYRSVKFFRG